MGEKGLEFLQVRLIFCFLQAPWKLLPIWASNFHDGWRKQRTSHAWGGGAEGGIPWKQQAFRTAHWKNFFLKGAIGKHHSFMVPPLPFQLSSSLAILLAYEMASPFQCLSAWEVDEDEDEDHVSSPLHFTKYPG